MKSLRKIGLFSLIGVSLLYISYSSIRGTYSDSSEYVFEDENFYKCVVDSYNSENDSDVDYSTVLTEQQLKKITTLNCNGESITSAKGIEKLTNLNKAYLYNNNLTEINLSENTKLTYLDIEYNKLKNIDLSNNTLLTYLEVDYNNLTEINVDNNDLLKEFYASDNYLSNIDLSNLSVLQYLDLSYNNLSNLDVTNNKSLYWLYASGNKLTNIDLTNNIVLVKLELYYNRLTNIDLSNNKFLYYLDLYYNDLTSIDLSNNTELYYVDLYYNDLTSLDITNNNMLEELYAGYNKLTNIDLSNNRLIEYLDLSNNNLSNINLDNNVMLTDLLVGNNKLSSLNLSSNLNLDYASFVGNNIESLELNSSFNYEDISDIRYVSYLGQNYINFGDGKTISPLNTYRFNLNKNLIIPVEEEIDGFIANLGLANLTAKVYNATEEVTSGNVMDGYILKVYDGEDIVQELPIVKFNNEYIVDHNLYTCIVDTYNKNNGTEISYSDSLSYDQLQTITSLNCSNSYKTTDEEKILSLDGIENLNMLKSLDVDYNLLTNVNLSNNAYLENLSADYNSISDIKVPFSIFELDLSCNNIENIDLSNAVNLEKLDLYSNFLDNINLDNNRKLVFLDLDDNKLTNVNLSNNILLTTIDLSYNYLAEIDLSNNTALDDLDISYNDISSIDIRNNTLLEDLNLSDNNISSLDTSNNDFIKYLYLSDNNVSSLDFKNNTLLTNFSVSNNNLTNLDLSSNSNLISLNVSSNNLLNIDLSNNTKLTTLNVYGNSFVKDIYLYKNSSIELGAGIDIPSSLNWANPNWMVVESDVATVESDGTVTALNVGSVTTNGTLSNKYNVAMKINVVELTSDKYQIDEENNYIVVGSDNVDMIKNNVKVSDGVLLEIDEENNKLLVKSGDVVLKEFDLINIRFNNLDVSGDVITILEDITYEDFIANITVSEGITYQIKNGEEEVTDGDITVGMKIDVYYNDSLINSLEISNYNLSFDSMISLDTENKYINYLKVETKVSDFLANVYVGGGDKVIYDKDGNVKNSDSVIATGDVLKTYVNGNVMDEYTLSVLGDANSDGKVSLVDLVQIRKHIVGWVDPKTGVKEVKVGVYYNAVDLNRDGLIGLIDLVRIRKKIVGIDDEEEK